LAQGDEGKNLSKRMERKMKHHEIGDLPLDDQFAILLHKKIMNKTGGAKRRAKKYYRDQYRKTGIIPKPLWLAAKGIMEGRKCSGRPRALDEPIKKRFVEMVKASSDPADDRFIFITQKGRTIKNYHFWLEQEFCRKISLSALRRCAREENLKLYLRKPDFDDEIDLSFCFKDEPVFDLVQIDGCAFRYLKIRGQQRTWQKPQVIEFYDTGSRYIFVLDVYFSESSQSSVDIFSQFLLSTPFPNKKIRLRPDNAQGFLNLKRPINALNIKYSMPDGFYLQPDFSRINAPKDKAHLESSHRSLHNFEMRIIKFFDNRIVKTEPGYLFASGKKKKITVTFLDIDIETLRDSGLLESYRHNHNDQKHYFSVEGQVSPWVPAEKFDAGLSQHSVLSFVSQDVQDFMKYGFDKIKATVSKKRTITFNNRIYHVAVGAEHFSRHKSTKVYISDLADKLFIFEYKKDGVLLGEALCLQPFEKKTTEPVDIESNEVELIAEYLQAQKMRVDRLALIKIHLNGLSLATAKMIYERNKDRYRAYLLKLRQPEKIMGKALFNAFILDCQRHLSRDHVVAYAASHES
jgi:hypothetical protein